MLKRRGDSSADPYRIGPYVGFRATRPPKNGVRDCHICGGSWTAQP